jgi:hypothetical protein
MSEKQCPDCKGELTEIKLFGRGWENPISGVAVDADLSYFTEGEAERSSFSGKFKPKGHVESYLCQVCGRIFLFGKVN